MKMTCVNPIPIYHEHVANIAEAQRQAKGQTIAKANTNDRKPADRNFGKRPTGFVTTPWWNSFRAGASAAKKPLQVKKGGWTFSPGFVGNEPVAGGTINFNF